MNIDTERVLRGMARLPWVASSPSRCIHDRPSTAGLCCVAILVSLGATAAARAADVDLSWMPASQPVEVGELVEISLMVSSAGAGEQSIAGLDAIVAWNAARLKLVGKIEDGPYEWLFSFFASDALLDGLNADCADDVFCDTLTCTVDSDCPEGFDCGAGGMCPYTGLPFNDGDGFYQALSQLVGGPAIAPARPGLLVVTLQFEALLPGPAEVTLLPASGQFTQTQIFGAGPPGETGNVTGDLGVPAVVLIAGDVPCEIIEDCADQDLDGVRDDGCVWWACESPGTCVGTPITFADFGGTNGACPPDGTADGNDRFQALNCFSNQNTMGLTGYPCETAPPMAFNVDAAGLAAPCSPDGVCDGNDAFAALNAFDGSTSCTCPAGPEPGWTQQPRSVGRTRLALMPSRRRVSAGETFQIEVYLEDPIGDLRGYQLHVGVAGGARGRLELVDIAVQDRRDHVFRGLDHWMAVNLDSAQVLVGMDQAGIAVGAHNYLATLTYRASDDAFGEFTLELLDSADSLQYRSVLFPTPSLGRITICSVTATTVRVVRDTKRRQGQ